MNISRKKQAKTIVLLSCLASGLLTVNSGQATMMQSPDESSAIEVMPLPTEEVISEYLTQTEHILKKGQFESVVDMSKKLLALQPGNVTGHALLAAAYTGLGEQALAQEEMAKVRDINPDTTDLYIYQAQAYRIIGESGKAEEIYQEGIKNSTGTTELTMLLAGLYGEQGKYKDASELFESVLQQQKVTPKDYLNASFALCRIDLQLQQYDQVIKRANRIIVSYPPIPQGYTFLGTAYLKKGKPEQAASVYKKLIQINPKIAEPYQKLALLYLDQLGDSGKALQYAEQVADKFPKDAKSQDVLGWVLYKNNTLDRAVQQFESAVQLAPAQAAYHYHLGLAELQKGKKESAKRRFLEALDRVAKQGKDGFSAELNRRIKECE